MASTAKLKKNAPPPASTRSYLLIGAAAVTGAVVLGYLVMKPKDVRIPANVTVLAADTAGFRGYVLGSDSAKIEVTEYADFQCPACGTFDVLQFDVVKRQLIETGLVRYRYRDFPLPMHPHARVASHAAACANDQGKFWEMKAQIYNRQAEWSPLRSAAGFFGDLAAAVGVNRGPYDECMQSAKYAGRIEASLQEGTKLGVPSTPTFLIGGQLYPGALSSDSLAAKVRRLAATPAQ
ncbi:MAG: DsbA family protein [Gemmatimonadetes bacterium]|nr:DsbA family protein [Gemmatimonadota bacterium]